jgi:hypothetical protein
MKKIFFAFLALLFTLSACKKDSLPDTAQKLLIGTWNQVDISSKVPTGKHLKFNENGSMEGTVYPEYNTFEISSYQLFLKGNSGSLATRFTVSTDSLYIDPTEAAGCCATLFAKQK